MNRKAAIPPPLKQAQYQARRTYRNRIRPPCRHHPNLILRALRERFDVGRFDVCTFDVCTFDVCRFDVSG